MSFTHLVVLFFLVADGSSHARLQSVSSAQRCHEIGQAFINEPSIKPGDLPLAGPPLAGPPLVGRPPVGRALVGRPPVGRAYTCNSINTSIPALHTAMATGVTGSGFHNQENRQ